MRVRARAKGVRPCAYVYWSPESTPTELVWMQEVVGRRKLPATQQQPSHAAAAEPRNSSPHTARPRGRRPAGAAPADGAPLYIFESSVGPESGSLDWCGETGVDTVRPDETEIVETAEEPLHCIDPGPARVGGPARRPPPPRRRTDLLNPMPPPSTSRHVRRSPQRLAAVSWNRLSCISTFLGRPRRERLTHARTPGMDRGLRLHAGHCQR